MRHLFLLTFLLVSMCFGTVSAQSALPEVILVSPADSGSLSIHDLTFAWTTSAPVGPDVTFDLHVDPVRYFTLVSDSIVFGISDTTYTLGSATAGECTWYVVARNASGDSAVSDTDRFVILCCEGETGDINADGRIGLTDLMLQVKSIFGALPDIPCRAALNTNGDANCSVTLTDITLLVNRLFVTFQPNAQCDEWDETQCYCHDGCY